MTKTELLENYLDLVNAIIEKAANDYRFENRHLVKQKEKLSHLKPDSVKYGKLETDIIDTSGKIESLQVFFEDSHWFSFIVNIDGKYILERLNKELGIKNKK